MEVCFAALKVSAGMLRIPIAIKDCDPLRQVSLGWTRDSVSGLCQEAKPPGPKFAEHRSRETELGKKDASNTLRTFIVRIIIQNLFFGFIQN